MGHHPHMKGTMMKTKVLLIDMDGVICQYDKRLLELAHTRYGLPLHFPEDVPLFDTHEIFEGDIAKEVEQLALEEGFFTSLEPMPGAIVALREIVDASKEFGFEVFFCTTAKRFYKNPRCLFEKGEWIQKHLGREYTDKLIFTRDKTLVYGTLLIDDKPVISGCVTPDWKHVHFDRAYNKGYGSPRLTHWGAWKETLLPYLI